MGKIGFLLTLGPYTHQNADTTLKMVNAAIEEGHEVVGIYLYVDGVYNVLNRIDPKSEEERNVAKMFEQLASQGIPIKVCPVCGYYRGLDDETVIVTGVEFDGLGALAEIFEAADKVVVLT
ncbi:MAG: DsrE/DsrF/TusD sulfur relay family protein [Candidatus Hodarchaeota archaeon]